VRLCRGPPNVIEGLHIAKILLAASPNGSIIANQVFEHKVAACGKVRLPAERQASVKVVGLCLQEIN
jgi:hypothetical protein